MPSAPGELRRKIVDVTRAEGIPVKTLPGLHELISGDVNLADADPPGAGRGRARPRAGRGRPRARSRAYVRDRTVLVTGAGGSIGSELCRQLARLGAQRLVLVEQGESALYEIERELVDERALHRRRSRCSPTAATPSKMRHVFERCRPAVVFHAAAYKHVPMLEANPLQAVTNNVLATRVIAEVAVEFGVERFVLISTDKAAKPKNLLGQSKAVCEWIVESFAARDDVDDALRRGALRQRARLVRLGDPDLPPPDRARRPGHRDAPAT